MKRPRFDLIPIGVILLATAMCPKIARPQTSVRIDSLMLRYLETVAETTHTETARCIVGVVQGDTVKFTAAAETPWLITEVTDSTVSWQWWGCPMNTVALWHAHPLRTAMRARDWHWPTCNFSKPDATILRVPASPMFSLVSVRRRKTCVFVRIPGTVDIGLVPGPEPER